MFYYACPNSLFIHYSFLHHLINMCFFLTDSLFPKYIIKYVIFMSLLPIDRAIFMSETHVFGNERDYR